MAIAEQCLHSVQGLFFFPTLPHQRAGWGCTSLGKDAAGTADPRVIPDHMILCSARKAQGKEKEEGGMPRVTVFVFPSNCQVCRGPACQDVAEHLRADGKGGVNSLFHFACTCSFASLIKLPLYQRTNFSCFCPSSSLPQPARGKRASD